MRIESLPFADFNRRIAARDFDAVMIEFIVGNSPSRPFTFWHSTSKQNVWGFQDPEMDQALDGIRRASNETDYREAFRDFQLAKPRRIHQQYSWHWERPCAPSAGDSRWSRPPNSDILPTIGDWRPSNDSRESELRRITSRFVIASRRGRHSCRCWCTARCRFMSLRDATRRSVIAGNENVARRVAEQIGTLRSNQRRHSPVGGGQPRRNES